MSNDPFHPLATPSDWTEARAHSEDEPVLVFKHSSACPISTSAHEEMQALATGSAIPVYKLVVQQSRDLSNEIADVLGVHHETPQAIVLDQHESVFDTSHFDVTAETLREAIHATSPE